MTEKYIKASECEKYFYEHLDDNGMIGAMNAIDEMPAADVQPVDRWISCKDEMPEDGISALICSYRGTVSKATYDSDMGYFYIADSELHYNELDITHWRHLPTPPNE